MSGYIGNIPVPQATQTRDNFTATSGQTTFSTSGYTPSYLDVYLNGVHLDPSDYTATNGTDVVLGTGATAGDIVSVVAFSTFEAVDQDFSGDFSVDGSTFVVDSTNDRIGIGTSSPTDTLTLDGVPNDGGIRIDAGGNNVGLMLTDETSGDGFRINYNTPNNALIFNITNGVGDYVVERMRIDSSGNLLVGKTSTTFGTEGIAAFNSADGGGSRINITNDGGVTLNLNRLTTDGSLVGFYKDGTTVGSIGSNSGSYIYIGSTSVHETYIGFNNNYVYPANDDGSFKDNAIDLGNGSARYDDIYATNGTIQTSDEREKQDIDVLSDAEHNVAVAAKGLIRKFRWKDAVAEKGDDARIHFGVIAQDLKAAFEAEGLDAGRYAMFIHSEWWETYTDVPAVEAQDAVYEDVVIPAEYDDEGNEITPETTEQRLVSEAVEAKEAYTRTDTYDTEAEAPEGAVKKDRMGVRYPELLAFIIGAL